jgi:hypothetical protein
VQKTIEQVEEMRKVKRIFPPVEDVFKAFRATPLEKVRVVIVGQEPWWLLELLMKRVDGCIWDKNECIFEVDGHLMQQLLAEC